MIEHLNRLYLKEVEDNKCLKSWVDKLAEFILNEHYCIAFENEEQWRIKKEEIVIKICLGE